MLRQSNARYALILKMIQERYKVFNNDFVSAAEEDLNVAAGITPAPTATTTTTSDGNGEQTQQTTAPANTAPSGWVGAGPKAPRKEGTADTKSQEEPETKSADENGTASASASPSASSSTTN